MGNAAQQDGRQKTHHIARHPTAHGDQGTAPVGPAFEQVPRQAFHHGEPFIGFRGREANDVSRSDGGKGRALEAFPPEGEDRFVPDPVGDAALQAGFEGGRKGTVSIAVNDHLRRKRRRSRQVKSKFQGHEVSAPGK